jgi:hypothetical protein
VNFWSAKCILPERSTNFSLPKGKASVALHFDTKICTPAIFGDTVDQTPGDIINRGMKRENRGERI